MQDFRAAAQRHYKDARFLHDDNRHANADHLAGLAAECALKAVLTGFLNARPGTGKPISIVNGKQVCHGHLPTLWGQVQDVVAGRAAATAFAGLVRAPNPFVTWSVHDRYDDGASVDPTTVRERIDVAGHVLGHLERATLLGALG